MEDLPGEGDAATPEQGRISVLQVTLLLWLTRVIIGVLFLGTPGIARQDAWLAELAVMVGQQGILFVILALIFRFPGHTLVQIFRLVLGRFGGALLGFIYLAFFLHFASAVLRSFADFLVSAIMPLTPISVVIIALGSLAAYATRHGIEPIGRVTEAIFPVVFVGVGLILLLVLKDARFERLLPMLEQGVGPLFKSIVANSSFAVELIFLPTLAALIHDRRGLRLTLHGMMLVAGVQIAFMAAVVIAALGTLGAGSNYATFELARQVTVADFIERIEPLFMTIVVMGYFLRTAFYLYASAFTAAELFGLRDYRPLVLPALTIILPLVLIQWEGQQDLRAVFAKLVLPGLAWLMIAAVPAGLWLIAALRGLQARPPALERAE